jgi:hypothetical protein
MLLTQGAKPPTWIVLSTAINCAQEAKVKALTQYALP